MPKTTSLQKVVVISTTLSSVHELSKYSHSVVPNATLLDINNSDITTEVPHAPVNRSHCGHIHEKFFSTYFGLLAVPEWEAIITVVVLTVFILLTIVGNFLVILSVFTYKPLRIVQNFFIVSLAVADLTVALLVMPFNVAYSIRGRWEFGIGVCKIWLTSDIMCCTSSILNLCTIALDRYWAITDPVVYAQKRTVSRVLLLIAGVWILSLVISSPPLVGWNDWPDEFSNTTPCQLTSNRGYVIYSSLGSFFIPLCIMTTVYVEIYIATRRRLRERAQASKINTIVSRVNDASRTFVEENKGSDRTCFCLKGSSERDSSIIQQDHDSLSSEPNINVSTAKLGPQEHKAIMITRKKSRRRRIKDSIKIPKAKRKQLAENDKDWEHKTESPQILELKEKFAKKDDIKSDASVLNIGKKATGLKPTLPQPLTTVMDTTDCIKAPKTQKKPFIIYQFIEEKQKISLSKERRAARTLGVIMGVFVICWLPFFLMYVILPFCDTCCPTDKLKNFITWLGYINSGLNPIIYTIFNIDYRRAFKRLLHLD